MPTKWCLWDLDHEAQDTEVLSGLNFVDTTWLAVNYYKSKTTLKASHIPTDWQQTQSSEQRSPSTTLV